MKLRLADYMQVESWKCTENKFGLYRNLWWSDGKLTPRSKIPISSRSYSHGCLWLRHTRTGNGETKVFLSVSIAFRHVYFPRRYHNPACAFLTKREYDLSFDGLDAFMAVMVEERHVRGRGVGEVGFPSKKKRSNIQWGKSFEINCKLDACTDKSKYMRNSKD